MTSPAAAVPREGWRNGESILLAILVAITLLLAVAPVLRLVLESLFPTSGGGPAIAVLKQTVTWTATRRTLEVSIGGTLLAALVGTAMALLAALTDIRARPALVFGFVLPLMIPPQVTSVARKPLSIAFEEISVDKIVIGEPVVEPETDEGADLLGIDDADAGGDAEDQD